MTVRQLKARPVPKIWGCDVLPPPFERFANGSAIGELRFEDFEAVAPGLSVKYLFTRQKMSIQVHPRDEAAGRGGDEAWIVISAARGAAIGLGTRQPVDSQRLIEAAEDGSIDALLDWRAAKAGSAFYAPAGTVHSVGGDLVVLEIREDPAVTYRLYDFGRPRPLHLEQALAAIVPAKGPSYLPHRRLDSLRELIVESDRFAVERWTGPGSCTLAAEAASPCWITVLAGCARVGNVELGAGTTWVADGAARLRLEEDSLLIVAYAPLEPYR